MSAQWEKIREYLDKKFTDPEFYRDAPGTPLPELIQKLHRLAETDNLLPRPLAKARAFELVCAEVQIRLSQWDIFPALASCQTKPIARTHTSKWEQEAFQKYFTAEELDEINSAMESRTMQIRCDFDHCVPDWDAVLQLGLNGLRERICRYEKNAADTPENRIYFDALKIEYQAALSLLDRLIAEAEKQHLDLQTAALKNLRTGSAGTFYEALLQIWLYFQLSEYIDLIQTRSFGNLDRVLYPYYKEDLASGRYTQKDICFFIQNFLYEVTAMRYTVGHPFYFGGTNADGSSAINELSYLILDEYDRMGIFDPKLHIKVSEQTPTDFIDHALQMIRSGRNSIAFVGEPCIIRTMQKYGYSLREAQTADIKGCYEYCVRSETVETAPVTVNTAKVLGLALHNGIEPLSGKRQGPPTGSAAELTTFPRLYRAFLRQLFYQFDRNVEFSDRLERKLDEINPAPLLSGTFKSSLEKVQDGYARGARYNNTNLWICGAATAADSLTMIKRYVFERKEFTLEQLVAMLDRDFEGDELIRRKLLHDPEKYGNNLESPDRIAVHFTTAVARRFNGRSNARGGIFTTSLHASNRFTQWADRVEATADGRKRGDELAKNMTATQGCAMRGATSLIASVLKFDSADFMADLPVDIMLHPAEIKGASGLLAMRHLLMTYIKNYGHAIHFNVMEPTLLRKAQAEPEKYRDLQVRICGWNVLWNSIPRHEQDAYIRQAEKL